jgi:hypothetical protein
MQSENLMRLQLPVRRLPQFLIAVFLLSAVPACGPSKQEMMMRAAKRARPKAANEVSETGKSAATNAPAAEPTAPKSQSPSTEQTQLVVEDKTEATEKATDSEDSDETKLSNRQPTAEEERMRTIDERKQSLTEAERRQRAKSNIIAVAKALEDYYVANDNLYPRPRQMTSSGIPTLSWRVELLPYLGYEDLYQQFDPSKPWDMEPNKSLLKYIPDEYASPERFDEKTNLLLPANEDFFFGDNKRRGKHQIEDGAEDTLILVEVDDPYAVPWTKPQDWDPLADQISKQIGSLRGGGAYAVWGNGWPTLISKSVPNETLRAALTYEMGESFQAGMIHRAIPEANVTEASTASIDETADAQSKLEEVESEPATAAAPPEAEIMRQAVPASVDLNRASSRLRELFTEKIRSAKYGDEKSDLATEMLEQAEAMTADHPGAYALQNAAMRLATEAGNADVLVRAIDQRVIRFEVDAYKENVEALTAFSEATASMNRDTIEGKVSLLERVVHVIHAAISENDFIRGAKLARLATRVLDRNSQTEIYSKFSRLRSHLGAAQSEYEDSIEFLQAYRNDPSNVKAGAAFGKFLCFIKGDWDTGLPLIAKGDPNDDLRTLAQLDLEGADAIVDQVALGDAWWDLGSRGQGVYRQSARDRAVMWYLQAFERMPESLDRIHVKNRLSEVEENEGTSPLALCSQLAVEYKADLSVGLISIAKANKRSSRTNRDDDYEDG